MRTKILLLSLILFCGALAVNAQINKGKYLLGGSISYNNSSNPTQESFYSNFQIGKLIRDNTVIGIIGAYSSNNYNYNFSSPNKTRTYNVGIFYRKYKELANKFYFFGEADASYSYSRNIQESYNVNRYLNSKSNGISISFIPGISYAVCKRMQMDLLIPSLAYFAYSHVSTIDSSLPASVLPQKRNTYSASINLNSNLLSNFAIGFKFLLGK